MTTTFRTLDWKRGGRAVTSGTLLLVFVFIVGNVWQKAEDIVDALLDPGFRALIWWLGGTTHSVIDLFGLVIDIFLYGAAFYLLFTLKDYFAARRARPRS